MSAVPLEMKLDERTIEQALQDIKRKKQEKASDAHDHQ